MKWIKQLLCWHEYEFDWDHKHGYTTECRKCGKN